MVDGLKDGIISRPDVSKFDPVELACTAGETDSCLTPSQVATARGENIGGFDEDGNFQAARSVAHPLALRRMFEYGRINEAKNLDDLPIIDLRGNPGRGPDVHDAVKSMRITRRHCVEDREPVSFCDVCSRR